MDVLFLTNRHQEGFFTNRLRAIFRDVDPSINLVFVPASSSEQSLAASAAIVISEVATTNIDYENGVLFPFNEPQVPPRWEANQRQKLQFYIITAFFARAMTARHGLSVSAALSSPLCWLPPCPSDIEPGKVVLHYPKIGNWTDDDIAKFVMYTVAALSKDTADLSQYVIVAECAPFDYQSMNGEKVVFVDQDGLFLWHMLSASLVVSMSHSRTMEMIFLAEAIEAHGLPLVLRSESMIHQAFTPKTILDKFSQPRSYTEIKTTLVTQDWYYRVASEQRHYVDVGSGIDNQPVTGRVVLSLDEYHKILSQGAKNVGKDWEKGLVQGQQEQRAIMVEKMGKLVQRLTKA